MRSGGSGKNLFIIIFILLVLGFAAFGFYYAYRNIASIKILPWLTEEIGSKPVLTMADVNLEPGQVYAVTGDLQGWQIKQKNTKLYEYLVLNNVDLRPNDVIAPHLYMWWFDGKDDYLLVTNLPTGNVGIWSVVYSAGLEGWVVRVNNIYTRTDPTNGYGIYNYNWTNKGYHYTSTASLDNIFTATWDGTTLKLYQGDVLDTQLQPGGQGLISTGYTTLYVAAASPPNLLSKVTVDSFALYLNTVITPSNNGMVLPSDGLEIFIDATFFNGSVYMDLTGKYSATSYGNPIRLPTQKPWLWMVQQLLNDNKLHFKWFPKGTILQISDQNGNIIKKFTVTGNAINQDGQIEDYAIDLGTDLVSKAMIEAWVPSQKIRIYGPLGATVEIQDESGVVVGSGRISGDYVDIVLTKKITNGKIIVYADSQSQKQLDIRADFNNDKLTVKIYDNNVPVPDLLVRIADASGVVVAAGTTNQSGAVEFQVDRPLVEATIEVSGIWKNELIYLTETAASPPPNNQVVNDTSAERTRLLLLGLGLMLLVGVVYVVARNRVRI